MSLIFSALSEIDKQGSEGAATAAHWRAPAVERPAPGRTGVVVLAVLLAALAGAGVFWLLDRSMPASDPGSPRDQAAVATAAARAQPPARAEAPETAAVIGDAGKPSAESDRPPYAGTQPPLASTQTPPVPGPAPRAERAASRAIEPAPARPVADRVVASPAAADAPQAEAAAAVVPPAPTAQTAKDTVDSRVAVAAPALEQTRAAPEPAPEQAPMLGSDNYIKVGRQPKAAGEQAVAGLVGDFNAAMTAGRQARARAALDGLQTRLSPQSITLLRLQAWYAVDSGDDAHADELYARILQRLPDDINAGVNTALIQWRAGRRNAALARIDRLHLQHPESALVSRNWQVMHGQP